jgi:hypothetical protein
MGSNSIKMRQGQSMTAGRIHIDWYPQFVLVIKLFFLVCLGYLLYRLAWDPINTQISALIIALVALLPGYLWAKGRSSGLPILPLHTFMLIWPFALPLVAGHPLIKIYNQDEIFFSALSVVLYALSATAAWYLVTRRGYKVRKSYYVIPDKHGYKFFIFSLVLGSVFTQLLVGGVITLDPGVFAIVRSIILSFMVIAMFVLSYQMGRREISRFQTMTFIVVAIFNLVIQCTTLYLVGAMAGTVIALLGYAVGRQRIPWKCLLIAIMVFSLLQTGKQEIRERYFFWNPRPITLLEVPDLLMDWIGAGVSEFISVKDKSSSIPIYERVSLIHLLLFVERATPHDIPYLEGATYEIIPNVLVPRFFNPDKLSPHAAGKILNIHYGIQTEKGTSRTAIGWGILNEAYANFGLMGIISVACIMGFIFGLVGRWTAGAPLLSLENLVGITFIMNAIQMEQTMAVMLSVLFQSLIILILVFPLLVKRTSRMG